MDDVSPCTLADQYMALMQKYSSGDTNILIIKQKSRDYLCLTGAW